MSITILNKITLRLGILGHCETKAIFHPTKIRTFRVNISLQLLDVWLTTAPNEGLFNKNIANDSKWNMNFLYKTPHFKPTFQISKYSLEQQNLS